MEHGMRIADPGDDFGRYLSAKMPTAAAVSGVSAVY